MVAPVLKRQSSGKEETAPRWSPMRMLKTAFLTGTALQAGGFVGFGLSQWQHNKSSALSLDPPLTNRTQQQSLALLTRRHLQPYADLAVPPRQAKTLAMRYQADGHFRQTLAQQQALATSKMAPGTKAISDLTHTVIKTPPKIGKDDTVVLFAMFTQDGELPQDTRYYIDCLRSSFTRVIGVVCTDAPFEKVNSRALAERFSALVLRENHGLDFAGWALVMRLWPQVWQSKQLLFTNDSLFGPLDPDQWEQTVQRINESGKDLIGLVESFTGLEPPEEGASSTIAWHYQSYFFALKNAAMRNERVQSFWYEQVYSLANKSEIIREYEIGMTSKMRSYGLRTEALFSSIKEHPLGDPSITGAKELLDKGFNFLKRMLWRNPSVSHYMDGIDLQQATLRYPAELPPLPTAQCTTVNATLGAPHGAAANIGQKGVVDEVEWASPTKLVVRGWSLARSLNFVTDGNFTNLRVVPQARPDIAALTGDSSAGCSGFLAHLSREEGSIAQDLRLSVFGDVEGHGEVLLKNSRATAVLPPLTLRYEACDAGLCNQVYAHLSAWSLAKALDADVYVPQARTRSSFGDYNVDATNTDPEDQPIAWRSIPLTTVLDTDHIVAAAADHGLRIHLDAPDGGHAAQGACLVDRSIPQRQLTLTAAVQEARSVAAQQAAQQQEALPALTLSMPCPLLWIQDLWKDPLAVEMARSWRAPRRISDLATQAIAAIQQLYGGHYSAIHLRMEEDARASINAVGGADVYWQDYIAASRKAAFDPEETIYLSSGLMSYGESEIVTRFTRELRGLGYYGAVTYKELLLHPDDLGALSPEEQAALDLEILLPATKVVGTKWSSFSVFLQQGRQLHGHAPETTVLSGTQGHPEGYFRLVP